MIILGRGKSTPAPSGELFWGSADPRKPMEPTMEQRLRFARHEPTYFETWNRLPYAAGRPELLSIQTGGTSLAGRR